MSKRIKISENIYHLLIEKKLNHFTITSFSRELLSCFDTYKSPLEARVFAYKQIRRLANKNLLIRDNNLSPKHAKYRKSPLFKNTNFVLNVKSPLIDILPSKEVVETERDTFESESSKSQELHRKELLIIESEINEYRRLMDKYPQKLEPILRCYDMGQIRLLSIKGKLSALNNIQKVK